MQKLKSLTKKLLKQAKRENRKSIEKKLQEAKKVYDVKRLSLQDKKKVFDDLNNIIEGEKSEMIKARNYLKSAHQILVNLDEIGDVNEIKWDGLNVDDVGYIKKNRVYRMKNNEDGSIELEPYNKKMKEENVSSEDEDGSELTDDDSELERAEEDLMNADELISAVLG